ncbi:MAG: helix-turn-helix transcriptional regulator [Clostridia bacterium]|nr:helix-turn-helix transcriptional regulator [Clostridia bacterium]
MHREDLEQNLKRNKVWFSNNCVREKKPMVDLHWHDAFEALYVRSGMAKQQINVDSFVIAPGDVVIIRARDAHSTECISEGGCDIDYVQFTADILPDFKQATNAISSKILRCSDNKIRDIFDTLRQAKDSQEYGRELISVGLIYLLCGNIVNMIDYKQKSYPSVIDKICKYIEGSDDIRLESVASHFNYSKEHVSRVFHKELGISYRDYCNEIKMKKATVLLSGDFISIKEIAWMTGYSDESSFVRAFKRKYGITPDAFRRRKYTLSAH